jgi:hypothetical protein
MIYIEQTMKLPSRRQQYGAMEYESSPSICWPFDPLPLNPEVTEQEYQRRGAIIPSQEEAAAQFYEVHCVSPTLEARREPTFLVPDPDIHFNDERTGLYDLNCVTKQRISVPECYDDPLTTPRPIHPDIEWCSGFYVTPDVVLEGPTSDHDLCLNSETVKNHGAATTSSGVSDIFFKNIHIVDDSSDIDEQEQGTAAVLARPRLSFDDSRLATSSSEEYREEEEEARSGPAQGGGGGGLLLSTDPVFDRLRELMKRSEESQKQLQEWDMRHGLPKSHSPVMVNTSRSRRQLQTGKILTKWDGSPLISKKSSQGRSKLGKPRPRTGPRPIRKL